MDEGHCEESVNSPSEGSAESCTRRNTKTIKPCYVLLENTDTELKKHHEYCLKPPNIKKLPQKIRNARKKGILKKLQVSLYDVLGRHCIETPRDLENKKVSKLESVLELKETNSYHDVEKSERNASFPNSSMLCDNIFEKFSIKSSLENSIADLCHVEEKEKGADSVPIPEVQNAVSEKCLEHGKVLIESSQGRETFVSKYSKETSTDNTNQPSRINMIDRSPGEISQTSEADFVCSSVTLCNETRFSKVCHRTKDTSPLCELDPYLVSLLPGYALKLDLKDEFPRKNKIKEGNTNEHFVLSAAGVVTPEQETVGEMDALNQTMTRRENNESCLFKFEMDKVTYVGGPADATYEENMSKKMLNGDHNHNVPPSGCQSFLADVTTIKHSEVQKETALKSREVSSAEECGNSQPAKENSSAGELSGSTVKLLGTPRENSEMLCLDRLIELDESSDSDVQSSSHLKQSLERRRSRLPQKGLADAEPKMLPHDQLRNRPLPPVGCSNDSRAKERRTQRPNKRLTLICSSQLSPEESRIKVVESLTEVLQRRLDDSPDLVVQEDTILRIAKKVEKALFNLSCCVDQHYKNKYRSLLFNLKSTKNQHLFYKVILGLISPERLVQMNALELAPEELAEWRARERKHALQVIEKEEREAPRHCFTKFTHKGIVEIDRETYEDLTFQEVFGSQLLEDENSPLDAPAPSMRYSRDNHRRHTRNSGCFSDTGQMAADSKGGYKPPTHEYILKQKANVSKCLQSNAVYSIRGERWLQEDSPISPSIPKKPLQVEKKSKTSVIWKGLIQMFSLKQFAAEAYPVSGSGSHLFQALPDLLQSRGCILPEDVWAYLDSIWPANTKEMALIRFHPSLTKGSNSYNMLYSYLNKKQRYGIVGSNEMEMFMVPLAAYQPVPSKLHPLGGPGLDLCHPSLLLGLILPKRPPTGPDPLPKARRKTVTFKDNVETWYFPPPSQADNCQMQPPQHLSPSEPLCCHDYPIVVLPRHDPLISEELGSEMFQEERLHYKTAGGGASHSLLDVTLHSQCDSPWLMGQLGNLTPETLGAQSQEPGDEVRVCTDHEPLHIWSPLLPSESVCPNHCRVDGDQGVNVLDPSLLLNMLCPEMVLPAKASEAPLAPQIPSTTPIAGDTNSLVEEAVSLIQHLTQLQPHITLNQETQPVLELSFPIMSQETTSVLSPAVAGLEFPAVHQSEDDMCAQLQLLLSTLGGQTQPPSTC